MPWHFATTTRLDRRGTRRPSRPVRADPPVPRRQWAGWRLVLNLLSSGSASRRRSSTKATGLAISTLCDGPTRATQVRSGSSSRGLCWTTSTSSSFRRSPARRGWFRCPRWRRRTVSQRVASGGDPRAAQGRQGGRWELAELKGVGRRIQGDSLQALVKRRGRDRGVGSVPRPAPRNPCKPARNPDLGCIIIRLSGLESFRISPNSARLGTQPARNGARLTSRGRATLRA